MLPCLLFPPHHGITLLISMSPKKKDDPLSMCPLEFAKKEEFLKTLLASPYHDQQRIDWDNNNVLKP